MREGWSDGAPLGKFVTEGLCLFLGLEWLGWSWGTVCDLFDSGPHVFCGSSAEGFAPLQPGVFSGLGSDLFLVGLGCSEVVFSELCLVSSVLF